MATRSNIHSVAVAFPPTDSVHRICITPTGAETSNRCVPEETAVAFTYGRSSYAVMMATPQDLTDFAIGFSLSEQIASTIDDVTELEIVRQQDGIELRMCLRKPREAALDARRRTMAGPAGCGLCGIESLAAATRKPAPVDTAMQIAPATIFRAMTELRDAQHLNRETHALHAAGFWLPEEDRFAVVREDVGRHNALDKLIGALARQRFCAAQGFIALTSRVSIELVQKAAAAGCPMIVAVSAPTAYALRAADEAGLTIAAIARGDSFEVFTHFHRIAAKA